ncbi:hypothetical protein L204_103754 [Cryptococcus depauperatus]
MEIVQSLYPFHSTLYSSFFLFRLESTILSTTNSSSPLTTTGGGGGCTRPGILFGSSLTAFLPMNAVNLYGPM